MSTPLKVATLRVVVGAAALILLMAGGPLAAGTDTADQGSASGTVAPETGADEGVQIAAVSGCERWGARAASAKPAPSRMRAETSNADLGCPRGCACGRHGGQGRGGRGAGMGAGMRGPGMGRGHRALMESTWALIDGHESIERKIEEIPGGVRTVTTTKDAALVSELRKHVREMADLVETGGRIRMWDPLFVELFDHADAIDIAIEDVEGGVVVTETSEDPQVAKLIRAHAEKVLEFVNRGVEAYREETPLPEDYSPAGR